MWRPTTLRDHAPRSGRVQALVMLNDVDATTLNVPGGIFIILEKKNFYGDCSPGWWGLAGKVCAACVRGQHVGKTFVTKTRSVGVKNSGVA